MSGSYWGIQIGGAPDSGNVVRHNHVHRNYRAGIAVYGQHNIIEGNVASANSSANLPPSCRFDLLDFRDLDNTWRDNTGALGTGNPNECSDQDDETS